MWKLGVILGKGLSVAPHKGEQKRRFSTKMGHCGWGQDSSGHICPWCSLMHHRSHLAAWRSRVPVSSRQDGPVGWGRGGDCQQQQPQDPARAWLSPCARLRAGHSAASASACREGSLGHPEGCSTGGWGWPHSVGICEPRNSCVPVPGEGQGMAQVGASWEGSLSCEHPNVCVDTNSLEVTLVQLRCGY